MQDHPLLIQATPEVMTLHPEVLRTPLVMTEVLLLLTTDLQCLGIIPGQLLHLTTEAPVHHTIILDHQADPTIIIHHLTALQADQAQVTQVAAALVLRAEAQVVRQELVPQEVPEEEGGINSPLFFI